MKIIIGSDHGGYELKEEIKKSLEKQSIEFEDVGCFDNESVDYPEVAKDVANKVAEDKENKLGIIICGTGIGVSMAANKVKGIRAALCHDEFTAKMAREHNNANVLCLGGRVLDNAAGVNLVKIFVETPYSNEERHTRRINKIE